MDVIDQNAVKVISETCQEYQGRRYYLCGKYFQRDGIRLHRKVWEDVNGVIPEGYHIHHVDHNRSNNNYENLQLVHRSDHISGHHLGRSRPVPKSALIAAAKWHGSEIGKQWHRQHYEKNRSKLHQTAEFVCAQCGQIFIGKKNGLTKFCSNKGKTRNRVLSGVDNESRACLRCKKLFEVNKYRPKKYCGDQCRRERPEQLTYPSK